MLPRTAYPTVKDPFEKELAECGDSQSVMLDGSQTQTQSEFMTQNELTQIGDAFEESNAYSPPSVVVDPRLVSWGRLISEEGDGPFELHPRDPKNRQQEHKQQDMIQVLGCLQIHKSDKFNEFTLGRNSKMDIVPPKPSKQLGKHFQIYESAHSMVSNKHCTVYCMWNTSGGGLDVFVEDSSGNGTIINGTILLKRGEKRLIHTGDEVCLVNPHPLKKKVRNPDLIQQVQRRYTYIFVNVFQQQQSLNSAKRKRAMLPLSSVKRRIGVVDPRSMAHHSMEKHLNVVRNPSPKDSNISNNSPSKRVEAFYDIRDTLGSGTCGEVKRAISRRTGKEFAVKIISIAKRNRVSPLTDQESAALQAEASILKALDHPYIVKLYDVFVQPNVAIYLIMELMSGGDLYDRIVQKSRYTEIESRRAMRRLLNAVYYLHEKKSLVHRDLKPENILCVSRSNNVDVKLTDFGLAKSITQDGLKTFCGTPQYFAPEVMRRNYTIAGKGRYGREADMWSLGVILFVLLSGMPPFDVSEGFEALGDFKVTFPEAFWSGVSNAARDLVRQLLETDPKKRLSVARACEDPWIITEDGDTHTNPLDDPVAPMRWKVETSTTPLVASEITPGTANSLSIGAFFPENLNGTVSPVLIDSQVTPSHSDLVPLPDKLNSRSNRFRQIVVRSAEKAKTRSPDARHVQEAAIVTAVTTSAGASDHGVTMPNELTDDEICSRFSDESRSSISECTISTKGELTSSTDELVLEKEVVAMNRDSTVQHTNRKTSSHNLTPKTKGTKKMIDMNSDGKQQLTLNYWFNKKGETEA